MSDVPTLTGPRLVLRAPRAGDAAARLALGRDAMVLRGYGMSVPPQPLTAADAEAWLAEQRTATAWMITEDGALVGTVRLHTHVPADARAQVAIGMLSARYIGRGLGQEALGLVLDHAFGALGLRRVGLRVLATNERALRSYRALGFLEEGRERQSARTDDGWQDDVIMGLLASEWRARAA